MVRIIGSYISPSVRKVLVVLDMKGLSYEIDPIIPFMGDDRFSAVSPVRRIPVLSDIVSARSGDARFERPEADEAAHRHRVTGAWLPSEVRWSA
jgi:hypothetical protein